MKLSIEHVRDIPGLRERIPLSNAEIRRYFFKGYRDDVAYKVFGSQKYQSHPLGMSFKNWIIWVPVMLGCVAITIASFVYSIGFGLCLSTVSGPMVLFLFVEYLRLITAYRASHPFVIEVCLEVLDRDLTKAIDRALECNQERCHWFKSISTSERLIREANQILAIEKFGGNRVQHEQVEHGKNEMYALLMDVKQHDHEFFELLLIRREIKEMIESARFILRTSDTTRVFAHADWTIRTVKNGSQETVVRRILLTSRASLSAAELSALESRTKEYFDHKS